MFYEERVIDGKLMFRTTPDGEWCAVPYETLTERLVRAEAFVMHHHTARPEVERLTEEEIRKIEGAVIGPGKWPGFKDQDYCHVCGQNNRLNHQPDCAWAKAKALLSPLRGFEDK